MASVLVVDDDRTILHQVRKTLTNHEVHTANNSAAALTSIREHQPDCVLLDIMLPGTSGLEIFREIRAIDSKLPVIFITAGSSSETVIEAMQLGAFDYLVKPLDLPTVVKLVEKALETRRLMNTPVAIGKGDASAEDSDLLVGRSDKMVAVYGQIGRVAAQNVTVLIRGESGTGKELVARAIYQHSPRVNENFMAVNCAALPDALLESELFGHEKGAFTSADSRRIGKFEQCDGGTIFLDEVGDMAPLVQSKVLRLLQEQKFERVGGNQTLQTDVRIIAATNRNLEEMVEEGSFREDLFYRLNGFTIHLPPLSQRGGDLEVLIKYFLTRLTPELGKDHIEGISPEAGDLLKKYSWPGNVRELQSVIRQSLLNATGTVIVPDFLPPKVRDAQDLEQSRDSSGETTDGQECDLKRFVNQHLVSETQNLHEQTIDFVERYLLGRVLEFTSGNQSQASRILGITRGSLRNKIRSLGISIEQVINVDEDGD